MEQKEQKEKERFGFQTWRKVEIWVNDFYHVWADDKETAEKAIIKLAESDDLDESIEWFEVLPDGIEIEWCEKEWADDYDLIDPENKSAWNNTTYEIYEGETGKTIWNNQPVRFKREQKFKDLGL